MAKIPLKDRPRIEIDEVVPPAEYAEAYGLALMVAKELHDQYPKHPWRVYVSTDKTVIYIVNELISTKLAYALHTKELLAGPEALKRRVKMMAGEFLERYNIARVYDEQDYADQINPLSGMIERR